MKKITVFNLSAIAMFAPLIAFSQQINEIRTEGNTFNEGSTVKFEISFSGQGRCGLQFNFGDGSTSDFRVEDASKPTVAIKTYPAKGVYKIEASGKTLIRGLNSFTPCKGNAKSEIVVGTSGSTSVTLPTTSQNNQSPIPQRVQSIPTSSAQTQQFTNSEKFSYKSYIDCKNVSPCDFTWTVQELDSDILKLISYLSTSQLPLGWDEKTFKAKEQRINDIFEYSKLDRARGIINNYYGVQFLNREKVLKIANSPEQALQSFKNAASYDDVFGIVNSVILQYDLYKSDKLRNAPFTAKQGIEILERHLNQIDLIEPDAERKSRNRNLTLSTLDFLKKEQALNDSNQTQILNNANLKGAEFAKESGSVWKLYQKKDELSGKTEFFNQAEIPIGSKGKATAKVSCTLNSIYPTDFFLEYEILFLDTSLPSRNIASPLGGRQWVVDGRIANNTNISMEFFKISQQFKNVIEGSIKGDKSTGFLKSSGVFSGGGNEPIYRLVLDIPTTNGNLVLKIPPLADSFKQLIRSCK